MSKLINHVKMNDSMEEYYIKNRKIDKELFEKYFKTSDFKKILSSIRKDYKDKYRGKVKRRSDELTKIFSLAPKYLGYNTDLKINDQELEFYYIDKPSSAGGIIEKAIKLVGYSSTAILCNENIILILGGFANDHDIGDNIFLHKDWSENGTCGFYVNGFCEGIRGKPFDTAIYIIERVGSPLQFFGMKWDSNDPSLTNGL